MISTLLFNLKDKASLEIKEKIARVAPLDTPLLFYGETGTGKDFWVRYLHHLTPEKPFLNLNCGDVPETLLESEWFGYRRGAFTGADRDYEGKWRLGEGGIIYLNQIDLLSLNLQAKLLRIIERKRYYPLGSNQEVAIQARFVFSADATIEEKVKRGEFRSDLFYRISTYKIFIPPLRERKKDLEALLDFFAAQHQVPLRLSGSGRDRLLAYPWPGNIRELENFAAQAAIGGQSIGDPDVDGLYSRVHRLLDLAKSLEPTLAGLESLYIEHLLKKYNNKSRVASILGISRKSLYNKLKRNENR